MNIGITIGLNQEYESMWINGIKLNAIFLANTLRQNKDFNVFLIDTSNKVSDLTKVSWDVSKFPVYKLADVAFNLDLLITLGTSLPESYIKAIKHKNPNTKIVKYQCGNNYVVDMERVLFGDDEAPGAPSWDGMHDQTWLVPQQEYQNFDYFKTIYRQKQTQVKVVPFIWDPMFIERNKKSLKSAGKKYPTYIPKDPSEKKVSVMEPNINVVKYALIPILIMESFFRKFGEGSFKQIFIGSGKKLLKNNYFKEMLKYLDLVKSQNNRIKFLGRYPVATFLAEETDVVLSHQWANPLNYSYLDALYFKYPLVHNADFIKDAGYYYKDFKINDGVKQLDRAINKHDNNIDKYNKDTEKVLYRYTSTNPALVETYRKMVENLFEPKKHKISYNYNWKTNLYK